MFLYGARNPHDDHFSSRAQKSIDDALAGLSADERSRFELRMIAGGPLTTFDGLPEEQEEIVDIVVPFVTSFFEKGDDQAWWGHETRLAKLVELAQTRVKPSRGLRPFGATLVRGLAVLACTAGAVGVLSACFGSDEPSSDEPTTGASEPTTSSSAEPGKTTILEDRQFRCRSRVDLDLVRVTMKRPVEDAVSLDANCTGRIGRIEVDTWTADGVKVQNHGKVAHDLVIESGYVSATTSPASTTRTDPRHGRPFDHISEPSGRLPRQLESVPGRGGLRAVTPTDVICENCILGPNTGQTLFYADSIRSGARGTTICTGRFRAIRVEEEWSRPWTPGTRCFHTTTLPVRT